ncbi:hypothetical protein G6031_03425 [Dietzia sp. CQ4]|uniref:hypothetical protein n=1 Tax=Dietzia sp. (strain CQ4) TaxID=370437 RepID=UPI0015F8C0C1|nr:hypothetical protein [Dietzia sp. CQ4]MBB1033440.1 hypothetical protein [Dietzia sp. CQ4]
MKPPKKAGKPAIRIVAGSPGPAGLLANKRIFGSLATLLKKHHEVITLDDCQTEAEFLEALRKEEGALVTLVSCHGYPFTDGSIALGWRGLEITTPLPVIDSNAVVFNACYVLDQNENPTAIVHPAVQSRALVGGKGIVQRGHVTWFARELVRIAESSRRSELQDPHSACTVLVEICATLEAKRDRLLSEKTEVKPWSDIWSTPRIIGPTDVEALRTMPHC